ncbi:hypothetical protein APHAL10511_006194 [Amanita phalloides]|nr:hypothetical protein APHAL10511_006194 [Amanita phalloides]
MSSTLNLQNHLYQAFLQGRTADVALHIRGSWEALYRLHRVVLIQAGFFCSLFTAGFSESAPRFHTHRSGPDQIDLVFDDPNITRAAFEFCISKLYGGGPALFVPPSLIPSTRQPLSSSFYHGFTWGIIPDNHHPASPRFLLSLLATATYLSIPTVAAQALSHIQSTIGPHTVVRYLNFALGHDIGPPEEIDSDAAVGLENIAVPESPDDYADVDDDGAEEHVCAHMPGLQIHKENSLDVEEPASDPRVLYYGAISDKIGEACACWLARWGPDMLECEELLEGLHSSSSPVQLSAAQGSLFVKRYRMGMNPFPCIWRRGGLDSAWATTLLGADTLFIRGECERYELARRVVELRRHSGTLQNEETEWSRVFEYGIYYENMAMEDIIKISQDLSSTTGRPYVPLRVLQTALWRHSVLKNHIMSRPSVPSSILSPRATTSSEKDLGITLTTSDLKSAATEGVADQKYFHIFNDFSSRLGSNGTQDKNLPSTMDELYDNLQSPAIFPTASSPTGAPNNKRSFRASISHPRPLGPTFFGLSPLRFTRTACVERDPTGVQKWSPYPPCRFAIEFWDLDFLKEKARLHSQTVWYAGSLFNVYVQIFRKKEQTHLGIYLLRQSTVDVPGPSIPSYLMCLDTTDNINPSDERRGHPHNPYSPSMMFAPRTPPSSHTSPSIRATSELVSSLPSSPIIGGNLTAPGQTYRDPRSAISAYFTVSLTSATGSNQTRFGSGPDVFSIGQSWGWKFGSLRTEEYMELRDESAGPRTTPFGSEVSLRATVILGLV